MSPREPDEDDEVRPAALAARALTASALYAGASDTTTAWWADWFVATVDEAALEADEPALHARISARARRLQWTSWRTSAGAVEHLGAFLAAQHASDAELERFYGVGAWLIGKAIQLGAWAAQLPAARGGGFEGGWAIRGELDLDDLAVHLTDAPELPTLTALVEGLGGDAITSIARAIAEGAPSWDLEVPCPDVAADAAWTALLARFELGAAPPRELAYLAGRVGGGLHVRLNPRGIAAASVRVPAGDGDLVRALAAAGVARDHDERLAAVLGALTDGAPTTIAFARAAGGPDLVVEVALR